MPIADRTAARIARKHGIGASDLAVLGATGAINPAGCVQEIREHIAIEHRPYRKNALKKLLQYVKHHGPRNAVTYWPVVRS